jgi:hypothetical protein
MGFLAPPGADPQADVLGWVARTDAGEPYTDARTREIVDMMNRFHSTYGIASGTPPAPLFIGSGFTDDLFPVDEATRYVERLRREHPRAPVAMYLGDYGHQRAANKQPDRERLVRMIRAWFGEHVRGGGRAPRGVVATTQTCPRSAPSEGPFEAPTFAGLARGEVRFSAAAPQTVTSGSGDPGVAAAIDPAAGGGDGCRTTPSEDAPGTAVYRLPASTGYTLLGAPTVLARMKVAGDPGVPQLALRLWDVDGDTQTLVARGLYRPRGSATELFQLHPNGWRFAPGHVARLEVTGADAPYARPSNGRFEVTIERLELRLPVRDEADCRTVQPTAAPVVPPGQQLALGVRAGEPCGAARRRRPALTLRFRCTRRGVMASATVRGARVRRVDFLAGTRRVARDTKAPFRRTVRRGATITARAALRGLPGIRRRARAPRCR